MRIVGIKLIRSPFGKQRTLLSSSTVFKFSTHNVSTGPLKIKNLLNILFQTFSIICYHLK